MTRKHKNKNKSDFDKNIVEALKNLAVSLKNSRGFDVLFETRNRGGSIFEHIANTRHQLKERDIKLVPKILINPDSFSKDKKSKKFKNYYGKREGKNKKPYIKIITRLEKDKTERIVTIYTVRKKD